MNDQPIPNTREHTCGNCMFAVLMVGDQGLYTCRRFPPTLMYQPMPAPSLVGSKPSVNWEHQASSFPMVRSESWCGEHRTEPGSAIKLHS